MKRKIITLFTMLFMFFSISNLALAESTLNLTDINNHWAKENIETLIEKGAINGYEDNTFRPDATMTRAEFTKTMITSLHEDPGNAPTGHWAGEYMKVAFENGYATQQEFSNYDAKITRGEIARMISRALDEDIENVDEFKNQITDFNKIPTEFQSHIARAYASGIITGYEDGSFKYDRTATRAEASTMLLRLLEPSKREVPEVRKTKIIQGDHFKFENDVLYYIDNNGKAIDTLTNSTYMGREEINWYFRTMYEFANENDLYFTLRFSEGSSALTFWMGLNKENFQDLNKQVSMNVSFTNNGDMPIMEQFGENMQIATNNLTDKASHLNRVDVKPYLELSKKVMKKFAGDNYTDKLYTDFETFQLNKSNGDTNSEYYGSIKSKFYNTNGIEVMLGSSGGYEVGYHLSRK